jgi:site-specific DNA-methyltransferase (adenine-specific)
MKYRNWHEKDIIKNKDKQMRSVWSISTPSKSEKEFGKHPTQKPLSLLERIILSSTNESDIVLDPFTGSSTTGIVSLTNNRKFIGIDNSKEYLKLSIKRLEILLKQTSI